MSTDEYEDHHFGLAREYVHAVSRSKEAFAEVRMGVALAALLDLVNDVEHEDSAIARLMLELVVSFGNDALSGSTQYRLDKLKRKVN